MRKAAYILVIALLSACVQGPVPNQHDSMLSYASLLSLTDSTATVMNPWKPGRTLCTYNLTETSFKRVIVTTNSHVRLLSELGLADRIAGICEPEQISDSLILAMCADGRIADCGNGMYPNMEKIIALKPDAILVSPFEDTGYGQLEKLGVPLIQCADYMETSPLGRAEWMRFYGRLFGTEGAKASDSLFCAVSGTYNELAEMEFAECPRIMLDTKLGSAWYVAGGNSTIGQMIADAGAEYAFRDNAGSGSVPLSFETVYEKASDSDIWLLKNSTSYGMTYSMLESNFNSYNRFKPFKEGRIWVCDVYQVPYFEQTSFHPELLLRDFIGIFHPESGLVPVFYHPMKN